MSWLVQPRLVNGPFGDPGLYLDFRHGRRALLFDLGDLSALSSRELMRVSHAFVSHTHMDHFVGFDRLLRVCLHRAAPLSLVGPPDFIDQVERRIRSYTWNLLGEDSVPFRIEVAEVHENRVARAASFAARDAFRRVEAVCSDRPPGIAHMEEAFTVAFATLDHGIPSLAFSMREPMSVNVWRGALDTLGVEPGPWLGEAKRAVRNGGPDTTLIALPDGRLTSLAALKNEVLRIGPGQHIAYVTDAAATPQNAERIVALARGADQLFIEAVFLDADRALAEATRHLTAGDAGRLARQAGAKHLRLFHHSARYLATPDVLADEARAAFGE
ncbi:MAG TPA: MBL fold metallo-hydrolase [Microvirga sp.]|jgi:ribonuclease Z